MDSLRLSSSFLLLPTITREHIFLLPSPPLSLSTLFSAPFLKKKVCPIWSCHIVFIRLPYFFSSLALFFLPGIFLAVFLSSKASLTSCISFLIAFGTFPVPFFECFLANYSDNFWAISPRVNRFWFSANDSRCNLGFCWRDIFSVSLSNTWTLEHFTTSMGRGRGEGRRGEGEISRFPVSELRDNLHFDKIALCEKG